MAFCNGFEQRMALRQLPLVPLIHTIHAGSSSSTATIINTNTQGHVSKHVDLGCSNTLARAHTHSLSTRLRANLLKQSVERGCQIALLPPLQSNTVLIMLWKPSMQPTYLLMRSSTKVAYFNDDALVTACSDRVRIKFCKAALDSGGHPASKP